MAVQFEVDPAPGKRRRVQGGVATADVLLSAHLAENADVFPQVLALHVPPGSRVADVTYGKGTFWRKVPKGVYEVVGTDLATGVDCRALPYADAGFDAVVLDPPYMEGLFRRSETQLAGSGTHAAFRASYSDGRRSDGKRSDGAAAPKYHAAVLDLYARAGREALRVLKPGGVLIAKCQDEVSANRQRLTHVEIINDYQSLGFYAKDLFVVVRRNRPAVSRLKKQVHARKNHSYFLVFEKPRIRGKTSAPQRRGERGDGAEIGTGAGE